MKRYYYALLVLALAAISVPQNTFAQCACPTGWEEVDFEWGAAAGNELPVDAQSGAYALPTSNGPINVFLNINDPDNRNSDSDMMFTHPWDTANTCNEFDGDNGGYATGTLQDPWDSSCATSTNLPTTTDGAYGPGFLTSTMISADHEENIAYNYTFSKEAYICDYEVSDIDDVSINYETSPNPLNQFERPGSSFVDEVGFSASRTASNVPVNFDFTGSNLNVSGQWVNGILVDGVNGNLAPTDAAGRVNVSTSQPVDTFTMIYSNHQSDAQQEIDNIGQYDWWSAGNGATNGVSDDHAIRVSGWTFCIDPQAPPLPVELATFTATGSNDQVRLAWSTFSEINNSGFDVELRNGDEFESIGFVSGNGSTNERSDYNFLATRLDGGKYIFRLKQIDFDGSVRYTDEVEATLILPEGFLLTDAYPNPFNPTTQFTLTIGTEENVEVVLYNSFGQPVQTLFSGVMNAFDKEVITINATGLPSGSYYYLVRGETFNSPAKSLVLMK